MGRKAEVAAVSRAFAVVAVIVAVVVVVVVVSIDARR